MTKTELQELYDKHQCKELAWEGKCHDCGKEITVVAGIEEDGKCTITGGAVYNTTVAQDTKKIFLKCDSCFKEDSELQNFKPIDVYSRVVGFYRPVKSWNKGKQAEYSKRVNFTTEEV